MWCEVVRGARYEVRGCDLARGRLCDLETWRRGDLEKGRRGSSYAEAPEDVESCEVASNFLIPQQRVESIYYSQKSEIKNQSCKTI